MSDLAIEEALSRRTSRGRIRAFDAAVLVLLMLAIWQAIGSWTHGVAVSPPLQTSVYLFHLVRTWMFWEHAAATLAAFLLAFVLSALIGLALGLAFGVQRFAGEVAEPILAGFYTIPKVTLYPVVLLIFGLGMSAKVAFGVMHGLVPMTLFTLGAVRNLPPVLIRTAKVLRLSPYDAVGAGARLPARYRQRLTDQLFAEHARRLDRRDVLVAKRSRVPAGERDGAEQRAAVDCCRHRDCPDCDSSQHADVAPR